MHLLASILPCSSWKLPLFSRVLFYWFNVNDFFPGSFRRHCLHTRKTEFHFFILCNLTFSKKKLQIFDACFSSKFVSFPLFSATKMLPGNSWQSLQVQKWNCSFRCSATGWSSKITQFRKGPLWFRNILRQTTTTNSKAEIQEGQAWKARDFPAGSVPRMLSYRPTCDMFSWTKE